MNPQPKHRMQQKRPVVTHHGGGEVFSSRVLIIIGIFATIVLLIISRLILVQVIKGGSYRAQAERMYNGTVNAAVTSERGDIVMVNRDGTRFTLAGQLSVYYVFLDPAKVENQSEVFAYLQKVVPNLTIAQFDTDMKTGKRTRFDAPLTEDQLRKIFSVPVGNKIDTEPVTGVSLSPDKVRKYPGGSLAAHVLGFVGYVGDTQEGRYGLEKQYDMPLRAQDKSLYSNFFVELFSTIKTVSTETTPSTTMTGQATLVTTLEPEVQARAEETIAGIAEKWSPEETGMVVMDPHTGAILAMARNPTFDVNNFKSVPNGSVFTNSLIQKVYEMGSIMKPLVFGFALEQGAITPQTQYMDYGKVVVGDRTIYNFDKRGRGKTTMEQVLIQSLNTGMVFIMDKLDRKGVRDYFTSLGLRGKTGVDLPYEIKGLTSNLDTLRRVEYSNMSFGQGIAVTPLAMMRALSIFANHGKLVQPYIVSSMEYPYGASVDLAAVHAKQQKQILSPETVNTVAGIMTKLVDTNFKKDPNYAAHYSVAAKTGTAQIANPAGGYYTDRRLHTFFGFFPAYNPKFAIFMYAAQPKNVTYSAQTLSSPFLKMVQFLTNYYNIPPDRGLGQ